MEHTGSMLPIIAGSESNRALENEAVIQEAISRLTKGKTLIVIAHRLSTITDSDQIVGVKDGTIQAKGTHEELLKECSLYHTMWTAHMDAKEVKTV